MRRGIPAQIEAANPGAEGDLLCRRLQQRLEEETGLRTELAQWAVESWAWALGLALRTVVVGADAVVGGLTLLPERVGLEESRELLVVVEPDAQGLSYGGVARGWQASMGSTPVQIAIEALEEVVGEANTDHP